MLVILVLVLVLFPELVKLVLLIQLVCLELVLELVLVRVLNPVVLSCHHLPPGDTGEVGQNILDYCLEYCLDL